MTSPARRRAIARAVLVAALLGTSGCSSPTSAGATAASPRTGETVSASAADLAALAELARERVTAVRADDRSAFLATVDPHQRALLERQGVLFDNLRALPLGSLSYDVGDFDLGHGPDLPGSDPVLSPRVVEHLGLRGALAHPVSNVVRQSFVRRDGAWRLGAESVDTEVGSATVVQDRPWGGPRIEVALGDRLVVVTDAASVDASRLLARIERGSGAVDRRLGVPVPPGLLVDATRTGVPTKFNPVSRQEATAGVTTLLERRRRADGSDLERRAGLVMKLNPRLVVEASGNGELLTHELTHVALASWNRWVPIWLVEGVASWVESDDLRLPPYLPPTAVRALRRGLAAPHLPSRGDYAYETTTAYALGAASVAVVASRGGRGAVRRVLDAYRAQTRRTHRYPEDGPLLRRVLGVGADEVAREAYGLLLRPPNP